MLNAPSFPGRCRGQVGSVRSAPPALSCPGLHEVTVPDPAKLQLVGHWVDTTHERKRVEESPRGERGTAGREGVLDGRGEREKNL